MLLSHQPAGEGPGSAGPFPSLELGSFSGNDDTTGGGIGNATDYTIVDELMPAPLSLPLADPNVLQLPSDLTNLTSSPLDLPSLTNLSANLADLTTNLSSSPADLTNTTDLMDLSSPLNLTNSNLTTPATLSLPPLLPPLFNADTGAAVSPSILSALLLPKGEQVTQDLSASCPPCLAQWILP